ARESKLLRQALIGFNFQRFEYFEKYEPSLTLNFKRKSSRSPRQQLEAKYTFINNHFTINEVDRDGLPLFYPFRQLHTPSQYNAQTVNYRIWKNDALQHMSLQLQYQRLHDHNWVNEGSHTFKAIANYERNWSKNKKFQV